MKDKPKILFISSANPLLTAGRVAMDYYRAFVQEGYDIDFLTLYAVDGYPEIKYVYTKPNRWRSLFYTILYRLTGFMNLRPDASFFYTYEFLPQVPVRRVLRAVGAQYDLVLILFWQGMLSFKTIKTIYEKFHCQIHFLGVDYSQMSGGCHFTGDCIRYQNGCGLCPAISSKKLRDFTYYNVRYREKIYKEIKPIVYGNAHMRENFYAKSYLLKGVRIEPSFDIFDLDEFKPKDKAILKQKYGISSDKRFVIFFGCQSLNNPRKGISYLIESLSLLWTRLNETERKAIQIVVAGKQFKDVANKVLFDVIDFGLVSMKEMPDLYALADVFLSPSIDDAGPMMVNQSLSCGTPVVAFEMGTALESIKGRPTGYCAKLKDSEDFAKGIDYLFRLTDSEREIICSNCRSFALNTFSYSARVNSVINIYNKYNTVKETDSL